MILNSCSLRSVHDHLFYLHFPSLAVVVVLTGDSAIDFVGDLGSVRVYRDWCRVLESQELQVGFETPTRQA